MARKWMPAPVQRGLKETENEYGKGATCKKSETDTKGIVTCSSYIVLPTSASQHYKPLTPCDGMECKEEWWNTQQQCRLVCLSLLLLFSSFQHICNAFINCKLLYMNWKNLISVHTLFLLDQSILCLSVLSLSAFPMHSDAPVGSRLCHFKMTVKGLDEGGSHHRKYPKNCPKIPQKSLKMSQKCPKNALKLLKADEA